MERLNQPISLVAEGLGERGAEGERGSAGHQTNEEAGGTYVYDTWNWLYSYTHSGSASTYYGYDGRGRGITETESGTSGQMGCWGREKRWGKTHPTRLANWQVLEERLDSSSNAHAQYVWGLGYVNDLVLRDRDADSNSGTGSLGKSSSGLEERLYAEQDANYNVTSLTNTSGTVVEQYQYDPYGKVTYMDGSWGGIGSSAKGWQYLFQGGRQDAATGDVYFQHRDYDTDQGRWKTADMTGYPDGGNRYQMEGGRPLVLCDHTGLAGKPAKWTPPPDQPTGDFKPKEAEPFAPEPKDRPPCPKEELTTYLPRTRSKLKQARSKVGPHFILSNDAWVSDDVFDAYMESLDRILKTKHGKEYSDILEKEKRDVIIQLETNPISFHNQCLDKTKIIVVTNRATRPILPVKTPDGLRYIWASRERVLAHELGHAVTGAQDDGPGGMNNTNENENPIVMELGLYPRDNYHKDY